eukprot:4813052-Prorocentrum_lima.AAC.1
MDFQAMQDEEQCITSVAHAGNSLFAEEYKHPRLEYDKIRTAERMFAALDQSTGEVILKDVDVSVHDILDIPKTFREAVTGPEKKYWLPSIKDEIRSLVKRHTWDIVRRPK